MRLAIPRRRLPETPLEKLQFEQANAQSDAEWPMAKLPRKAEPLPDGIVYVEKETYDVFKSELAKSRGQR